MSSATSARSSRVAAPSPPAEPARITAAAEDQYRRLIDDLSQQAGNVHQTELTFYYSIGVALSDLTGDRSCYDRRTVAGFVHDFNAVSPKRIGLSSAYKSMRFAASFAVAEVERLARSGWAWRNAIALCSTELTQDERKDLVIRVETGEIALSRLWHEIRERRTRLDRPAKLVNQLDGLHTRIKNWQRLLDAFASVDWAAAARTAPRVLRRVIEVRSEIEELVRVARRTSNVFPSDLSIAA